MMSTTQFTPSKNLTFQTAPLDAKRLGKAFDACQDDTFEVQLSQVISCDTAGLALLIEAKRWANRLGKRCCFSDMSADIKHLAQFCGVESLLMESSPL